MGGGNASDGAGGRAAPARAPPRRTAGLTTRAPARPSCSRARPAPLPAPPPAPLPRPQPCAPAPRRPRQALSPTPGPPLDVHCSRRLAGSSGPPADPSSVRRSQMSPRPRAPTRAGSLPFLGRPGRLQRRDFPGLPSPALPPPAPPSPPLPSPPLPDRQAPGLPGSQRSPVFPTWKLSSLELGYKGHGFKGSVTAELRSRWGRSCCPHLTVPATPPQ